MKDEEKEVVLNQDIKKEDKQIDKEKLIRETLDNETKRYMQLQKSRSERETKVKEIYI